MIAMGAVYQLVPVVLQNHKLFSERLGYIQYGVFTLGFAGLVIGFQQMNVVMVGSFAADRLPRYPVVCLEYRHNLISFTTVE